MEDLGTRMKLLRTKLNLTQAEIAASVGVNPTTIGRYEKGQLLPDSDVIIKISKLFNVSFDFLLTGENADSHNSSTDYNLHTLSNRLKELMDIKSVKPADLCRATNINKSNMSRILNGSHLPNSDTLHKISQYFDVSMEYLFAGEEKCCKIETLLPSEKVLLDLYNKLNKDNQEEIIGIINLKLSIQTENKKVKQKLSQYSHDDKTGIA